MVIACSTPVNTVKRESLRVFIENNAMNESVKFSDTSDCEMMDMDTSSPRRKNLRLVTKKLFHSPYSDNIEEARQQRNRKAKKRKQAPILDSQEAEKASNIECEQDGYIPDVQGGMRKRVLVSLFDNNEHSMDLDF